ncbi:hypothetical protein ACLB2K_057817 [Fragaria x ananassa]
MCHNKNSPPPNHDRHVKLIQTRSISMMKIIKKEEEVKPVKKQKRAAARKSRKKSSRRKKPKYLSLRSSRLSARNDAVSPAAVDDVDSEMTEAATRRGQQQQLNLFPLHPELNAAEAADHQSDDNVALLFESDGGATLHGLLTSADTATTTTTSTMSSDHDQAESNYGYRGGGGDDIVRTAMRGSGGDRSVEKWVCYSELVKEEVELTATATTSSASTCCSVGDDRKSHQDQRLALKLDCEEVLNAWSDKGSLYIKTEDGEPPPPQTVPDLLQDLLFQHLHDSSANIEDLWLVPEEGGSGSGSLERKRVQRQESLLRYKRKRENRLFSKQIRYEVRKLNAEKRPRVKGRFVRSS